MKDCVDHRLKGSKDGYAYMKASVEGLNKWVFCHRYVFFLKNGYWPEVVRHSCDNPRCINPEHLLGGSHKDNSNDRDSRGRTLKGDDSPLSKLSSEDIPVIKRLYSKENISLQDIANYFKVSPSTIRDVVEGKTWKHV